MAYGVVVGAADVGSVVVVAVGAVAAVAAVTAFAGTVVVRAVVVRAVVVSAVVVSAVVVSAVVVATGTLDVGGATAGRGTVVVVATSLDGVSEAEARTWGPPEDVTGMTVPADVVVVVPETPWNARCILGALKRRVAPTTMTRARTMSVAARSQTARRRL
jgi:hypothetical protein